MEYNVLISFELTFSEFASMSEDLRHDGGGDDGGRVHVREVGVHVLGQHEQPNKAGPFRQPEQLGRPQHCSTLYRQTPSWKGRDLQNRQRFLVISKIPNLSKLVVCTYPSKSVKTQAGKFDDFLTVCQYYCIVNIVKCQHWISMRKEILGNHNMINSEICRVFFLVWQPRQGLFGSQNNLDYHRSLLTTKTPSWKGLEILAVLGCFLQHRKVRRKTRNAGRFWQLSEKIRKITTWSIINSEIWRAFSCFDIWWLNQNLLKIRHSVKIQHWNQYLVKFDSLQTSK